MAPSVGTVITLRGPVPTWGSSRFFQWHGSRPVGARRRSVLAVRETAELGRPGRTAGEAHCARHRPRSRPCASRENLLRRVRCKRLQQRGFNRGGVRSTISCYKWEASKTDRDAVAVASKKGACILLLVVSCMISCARDSLQTGCHVGLLCMPQCALGSTHTCLCTLCAP